MTKIKNTKKGMAKKTLSMSLVVAMLATSNVPVWAAEFSDGTDVAVTSETPAVEEFSDNAVETPVVEDEVTETSNAQVAEGYTVTTNLALKKVDWNAGLSLEATDEKAPTFTIENKDGVETEWSKAEIWVGDSYWEEVAPTTINKDLNSRLGTVKYTLANYKADPNVTVKVFVDKDTCVYEFKSVIQPVDITKCTFTEVSTSKAYNGTVQHPEITLSYKTSSGFLGISPKFDTTSEVVIQYEDVTYAKNVGSYGYKIVGVEAEGYTGTIEGKTFEITPAVPTTDNLSVTVSGSVAYGKDIKSLVTITDKYTNEVIPSELYTVTTDKTDAGEYTYADIKSIKLNADATINKKTVKNNFKDVEVTSLLVEGSYTISAFDLSALSENYTVNVATKKINKEVNKEDITFTDKEGKTFTYDEVIPASVSANVEIKTTNNTKPGNGTVTLAPKTAAEKNVTGTFSTSFTVVDNIITADDVAFPAGSKFGKTEFKTRTALTEKAADEFIKKSLEKIVYDGSAQEPLKEAFSNLVLTDSVTTSDVKLVLGTDYDVTYSNNTDSKAVSGKKATITFTFKGNYTGSFKYEFEIEKAQATVKGNDIEYVNGKTSYEPSVKVTTANGKEVPASEYTVTTTKKATKVGDKAKAKVVFNNKNYDITNSGNGTTKDGYAYIEDITSTVVGKNLKNCTASIEGEYVYIGDSISPKLVVKDGDVTLVEGKDYKVSSQNNINAGKALVTIEAVKGSNYTGSLTLEYEIKKADLANAVVLNDKDKKDYDVDYSGTIVEPNIDTVKIGNVKLKEYDPITKTGDYTLTYDEAVDAGTYNFTITALASSKNVEGEFKGTFKVKPVELTAYFAPKLNLADKVSKELSVDKTGATYTGKAITIDSFKTKYVVVDEKSNVLTEGKDYRLEYSNNVDAGLASVVAYGLGNHAVTNKDGKDVAIASMSYYIEGKGNIEKSWIRKISDTEYAGGLPVEPEVVVYDTNKNRLEQGVDYTVTTTVTEIGTYSGTRVTIKGKGAYTSGGQANALIEASSSLTWKVTKKDLANTTISVDKENNVTVMNGTVVVPSSEYGVAFSEDGKKVTVTAKADSKTYTGSKEIEVESAKVGQAMISNVEVVGNQATVVLSDEVENASGYDYVIATEEDYQNGRIDIVKNQVKTTGKFAYVQEGTYYAYCHAWKRGEDGKKVFGEWSNLYKFTVTATTPSQPTITSVKVDGSTVTVTYTASENATGYDVVLGTSSKKVNGEIRPVEYGTLVKKNVKGNVVTVTFNNVEAGTYYAGLHAFNRTSVDGKKVFSQWSNVKTVTVK